MQIKYLKNIVYTRYPRNMRPTSSLELHIIVPHCVNWVMTVACVEAFLRLTKRPCSVSVVNNFDNTSCPDTLIENPKVSFIEHRWTKLGKGFQKIGFKRNGSEENALGLNAALELRPGFEWAMMVHTDSAPLIKNWDDYFFSAIQDGKILGNYRDKIRIQAAHASGTLFHQKTFLEKKGKLDPQYAWGKQILDVGDQATNLLHDFKKGLVPVLPNSINSKDEALKMLEKNHEILASFVRDGSAVTFDLEKSLPVFGHMGRGTGRSLKDPQMAKRQPADIWIEYINSLQ